MRHFVFLISIFASLIPDLRAAEPFFKPNDVVALVGGEDMVVAAELGYLETLIQLALPDHHLKFRSLAREGDTVFEQRRDLNYPKLEDQLDKIGATVVICQFGQMESLAASLAVGGAAGESGASRDLRDAGDLRDSTTKGPATSGEDAVPKVPLVPSVPKVPPNAANAKVAEFVAAYEKLIARLSGGGKRRFLLFPPHSPSASFTGVMPLGYEETKKSNHQSARAYFDAVTAIARKIASPEKTVPFIPQADDVEFVRDGVHWTSGAQFLVATDIATDLLKEDPDKLFTFSHSEAFDNFTALIAAKNRLWFHYYRPQNWAFLAGDRTNQPSSRDHLDPTKRWFPAELEQFLPLIDAKEQEIWALAEKLSAEGGK